ncbi:MAG: aromatic compound degradation protein PaaI [Dehalococcoidia bacterium]
MEPLEPREPLARLSTWMPGEAPPEGHRAALLRLAAALRDITEALMDMDAPEADLIEAAEASERFVERLEATRTGHRSWGYGETSPSGNPRALFDHSPLLGLANPVAPPLRLRIEEDGVVGTAVFGKRYEGPPGHVHGGLIAAAFDETLGMAQAMTGQPGMTGTLTIRYRHPTPLHTEVQFRASVDRVEGRKIFTSGTLHAGDILCAEAEGVFISVDFERLRTAMRGTDSPPG